MAAKKKIGPRKPREAKKKSAGQLDLREVRASSGFSRPNAAAGEELPEGQRTPSDAEVREQFEQLCVFTDPQRPSRRLFILKEGHDPAEVCEEYAEVVEEFGARCWQAVWDLGRKRDCEDLDEFARLMKRGEQPGDFRDAARWVTELKMRSGNPVLADQLRLAFRRGGLSKPETLEEMEGVDAVLEGLREKLTRAQRRGSRGGGDAARWLIHRLICFWRYYDGRGTTTESDGTTRESDGTPAPKGPFVMFVEMTGRLVDEQFNAAHLIRVAHREDGHRECVNCTYGPWYRQRDEERRSEALAARESESGAQDG